MEKQYYELVFEGHFEAIKGILEGFLLAENQKWKYYFSDKCCIKTETFAEVVLEWITLRTKLHHVIMEGPFYEAFMGALEKIPESSFINKKYVKSAVLINDASFDFKSKAYGKKYGDEIKAMINNLPSGLVLHKYNPVEKEYIEGKGVELYAPEHDYVYEASGTISGDINGLLSYRKLMDDHPLIEVSKIVLKLQ